MNKIKMIRVEYERLFGKDWNNWKANILATSPEDAASLIINQYSTEQIRIISVSVTGEFHGMTEKAKNQLITVINKVEVTAATKPKRAYNRKKAE